MTEKANELITKTMNPLSWLYPPDPDHPIWLQWKEVYGIEPPVEFLRKPLRFSIGCGWRDTVINYDENYVRMHGFKKECERLEYLVEDLQEKLSANSEKGTKTKQQEDRIIELEKRLRIAESLPTAGSLTREDNIQAPLQVVTIFDRGDLQSERVELKAMANINIKDYVVFDTQYVAENSLACGSRGAYWFSNHPVGAGNRVILYTRAGSASNEERNGIVYHFRFRGHASALYEDKAQVPLVMKLENWIAAKRPV